MPSSIGAGQLMPASGRCHRPSASPAPPLQWQGGLARLPARADSNEGGHPAEHQERPLGLFASLPKERLDTVSRRPLSLSLSSLQPLKPHLTPPRTLLNRISTRKFDSDNPNCIVEKHVSSSTASPQAHITFRRAPATRRSRRQRRSANRPLPMRCRRRQGRHI